MAVASADVCEMDLNDLGTCELIPLQSGEREMAETTAGAELLETLEPGNLFEQETKPLSCSVTAASPSFLTSGSAVNALLSAFRRVENCLSSAQFQQFPKTVPPPCLPQSQQQTLDTYYDYPAAKGKVQPARTTQISARHAAVLREKVEHEHYLEDRVQKGSHDEMTSIPVRHQYRHEPRRYHIKPDTDRRKRMEDSDVTQESSSDERYYRRPGRVSDCTDSDDNFGNYHRRDCFKRNKRKHSGDAEQDLGKRKCIMSPCPQGRRHCRSRLSDPPPRTKAHRASCHKYRRSYPAYPSRSWRRSPSPDLALYAGHSLKVHKNNKGRHSFQQTHAGDEDKFVVSGAWQKSQENQHSHQAYSEEHNESFVESPTQPQSPKSHHAEQVCAEKADESVVDANPQETKGGDPALEQSDSDTEEYSESCVTTAAQQNDQGNDDSQPLYAEENDNVQNDDTSGPGKDVQSCDSDHKGTESPKEQFHTAMIAGNQAAMLESLFRSMETMKEEVMTAIAGLRGEVSELRLAVALSLKHTSSQGEGILENVKHAELPEDFNFPLTTVEEVAELEERLTEPEFKENMVCALAFIGGKNIKSAVSRIMKSLVATPLALKYNFYGLKGKLCFQDLILRRVVFDAVRKIVPAATDFEIYKKLASWLSAAIDRDGGRKRREILSAQK